MSRDGRARPVSRKLRCLVEMSASHARSSWLIRRRWRHTRSRLPTGGGGMVAGLLRIMPAG